VSKLTAFWRRWVSLSQDFRGRGRPLGIFLVSTKLDTFCYLSANCTVLRAVVLTQYRHVTDGRQTDRIAIASTVLAMQALRRTLKTTPTKPYLRTHSIRVPDLHCMSVPDIYFMTYFYALSLPLCLECYNRP